MVVVPGHTDAWIRVRRDPSLLSGFTRLHCADDEDILDFARRWGVLELCDHGLPALHPGRVPVCLAAPPVWDQVPRPHRSAVLGSEYLATWRYWSAQADAILRVARPAQREHVGDTVEGYVEAWETLATPMPWGPSRRALMFARELREAGPRLVGADRGDLRHHPLYRLLDVLDARKRVADMINIWLALAGSSLEVVWRGDEPRYRRATGKLFGAIAAELVRSLQEGGGEEPCARCGTEVEVKRRRRREVLCQRCSAAAAQARYRRRQESVDPEGWRRKERERVAKSRSARRP